MCSKLIAVCVCVIMVAGFNCQVVQLGTCADNVATKKYFNLESFLGFWYEIERFPVWYEQYGNCPYKRIQYCERRIEIEHGYIRDGIHFILHLNSTYVPGDDAVFNIKENNIDPVGIPMTVIATDYTNYAVIYGCKHYQELGIKYIAAWILSRESTLSQNILMRAYGELNSVPFANLAYLERVEQDTSKCEYHWTAHIQAENKIQEYR